MAASRQKRSGNGNGNHGGGEFRSSGKIGTALLDGTTFAVKAIQYADVDGLAIVEGDIVLGTVEEVEGLAKQVRDAATGVAHGVAITGQQFRWPNCRIPYEIDPNLPNQQRVTDAIAHWEANTSFRFILRTAANAAQHPDFVRFVPGNGCSSMVGRRGGQQNVTLATNCSTGSCIHEIGHVVGLWHEQSREDRDQFVTIQWQNIIQGFEHNFNQHITDGDDIGAYDYGSIMHYPRTAFSANGQDTIVPTQTGVQIGQRNGLSTGDIAAANTLCVPVVPPTLKFRDDPTLKFRDDPQPTLKFRDDPTLKFRDDPTLKFQDDPQPTLKFRDDPKLKFQDDPQPTLKFRDDPPFTPSFRDPRAGAAGPPAAPFVLATPHHSMAWRQGFPDAYQAQLSQLEAEIEEMHQMLQEADQAYQQGGLTQADMPGLEALHQEYLALVREHDTLTSSTPR